MAGIVASTLRRKAFHRRGLQAGDSKSQVAEPTGHIASYSPTVSRLSSRSSSSLAGRNEFASREYRGLSGALRPSTPRGAKLCQVDFWPNCLNIAEQSLKLVKFETFDTLIPKANSWLLDNPDVQLVKCETIEKKVSSVDEIASSSIMFRPAGNLQAIYVKGLRLWYVKDSETETTEDELDRRSDNLVPIEIGYMNVIPKCVDWTGRYPIYENLPETYAAIDAYLSGSPLEGKIVTIETVPLKLPNHHRRKPDVNADQTCFPDDYLRHVLYITRIYFRYGAPEEELIGAQDFLPDFDHAPHLYSLYPKYCPLMTAMRKVKDWLKNARHISVTNIQTLEAAYKKHPDQVHTGVNFVDKIESYTTIRFVRVTYVRLTVDESMECRLLYAPTTGFSYKTFTPAPVKVAMCSGAPEYEPFPATMERAKVWLSCVNRRIVSVESVTHPLTFIWHNQDGGETTVNHGEWTASGRSERRQGQRRSLVHIVRVYLDGDFQEPSANQIPPIPMVEEIKDCSCVIT